MPDCSICLEPCKQPAQLKLRCKCKYCVHFKCYKIWWDEKHNCIFCRKRANPPLPYRLTHSNFEKISSNIKLVYSRSINYIIYRQNYRGRGRNVEREMLARNRRWMRRWRRDRDHGRGRAQNYIIKFIFDTFLLSDRDPVDTCVLLLLYMLIIIGILKHIIYYIF